MHLHALPVRTAGAAENMALDFLLLQRYPAPAAVRFRHYEWRTAAFTFGLSQRIDYVRAHLPPGGTFDLCRRPTGGGVVDHRNDWTYAWKVSLPLLPGRRATIPIKPERSVTTADAQSWLRNDKGVQGGTEFPLDLLRAGNYHVVAVVNGRFASPAYRVKVYRPDLDGPVTRR